MAASILGDLGADVVKVEAPDRGDPMRGIFMDSYQVEHRVHSAQFEIVNRSKRGITLDITKERGREILYKLIGKSDVFMHNFRPQTARRLGLDYETVVDLNPRLVYAQASGWGLAGGIDSARGAFDIAAAARTGFMEHCGDPDMPRRPIGGICDAAAALCLAVGTLAALQARERIGRGQRVDTSLFGSSITLLSLAVTQALAFGSSFVRGTRSETLNPLYTWYKCSDGRWIQLLMLQTEKYWPLFCEVMGLEDLKGDPRFQSLRTMVKHRWELIPILDRVFATKSREQWMSIFDEHDLLYAPIQTFVELCDDPQAIANGYITEWDHPTFGREKVVGLPYQFSETPASISPCPEFGQHTEEVLQELGYNWDDIARLKEEKVI
jgi:crotonobetainyl-CoA:carnitine CoA-transferase CaiB-like acyl-CoA transferase